MDLSTIVGGWALFLLLGEFGGQFGGRESFLTGFGSNGPSGLAD
jgi:hypothetical protein